jgi:hypothetical protein
MEEEFSISIPISIPISIGASCAARSWEKDEPDKVLYLFTSEAADSKPRTLHLVPRTVRASEQQSVF